MNNSARRNTTLQSVCPFGSTCGMERPSTDMSLSSPPTICVREIAIRHAATMMREPHTKKKGLRTKDLKTIYAISDIRRGRLWMFVDQFRFTIEEPAQRTE